MANSNKVRGVDLFNLTAPVTTAAIKVGFIDGATGYEYDYTICEANAYAQKNPGTVFIFKDGDNNIRYLNINEVNKLTPNDTLSTETDCGGLQQVKPCGAPKVQFFGGGGIGAAGNPIIGVDGAVLAVDLIRGGHGYQYPPLVDLNDPCNNTNGAVLVAVLGEVTESYETYDKEADFEDYEICPDTTVGFGRNWGPNGEDLGPWQPEAYTGIGADPIAYEIDKYQKSLSTASNPFWTTRKKKPLKISYGSTLYNQTYLVSHPAWNPFTNTYAISPVPPSNVPGTDNSGKLFVFEWEVDFPYDGEYIIRGLCDNVAKVFIDNQFIADLNQFLDVPTPIKKTYKAGKHKIYINLLNVPIYAPIVTPPPVVKYAETVDMRRFFTFDFGGPAQSQHFYTSNPSTEFIAENNLYEEVLAFKLFKDTNQVPGTVPVYRLFYGPTGDHLYVASIVERDNAVAAGYNFEGIVGAAYDTPGVDRAEVVRYFRPGTGEHFLTLDTNEMQFLSPLGFQRELTAFYAPITIPILGGSTSSQVSAPSAVTGFNGPGIYLDMSSYAGDQNVTITVSGRSGLDYMISIPNVDSNISKLSSAISTPSTKSYTISGGKIYGPCTASVITPIYNNSISSYTGDETPSGDNKSFIVDEGYQGWDNVVLQVSSGSFKRIFSSSEVNSGTIISSKSWNENPMGVSLTIDAPPAPVPQEKPKVQSGRCPPNPIWSTRFPAKKSWYPVRYYPVGYTPPTPAITTPAPIPPLTLVPDTKIVLDKPLPILGGATEIYYGKDAQGDFFTTLSVPPGQMVTRPGAGSGRSITISGDGAEGLKLKDIISKQQTNTPSSNSSTPPPSKNSPWSNFMNRYALSPVPPLDTPSSDSAGVTHSNDWEVDIAYDGYYAVKATADNSGRILIDGKEVHNAEGFNVENPGSSKIFLTKGKHKITTEVTNSPIDKKSTIDLKIFSTLDWQSSIPIISKPVETVDMRRFFTFDFGGPAQSQHFYTSNPTTEFIEQNNLNEEGLAFKLFKDINQVSGTVPVYRLFHGPTGDHLYTTSIPEKDNAVAIGYNFEGVVGAAYDTPGVDRSEVIRYFRLGTGEHFLTLDTNEMPSLAALGFQREGTAFYAPTVIPTSPQQTNSNFITQKDKITYEGIPLVHWNDKRWSDYMNKYSVSPYLGDVNSPNAAITGTFTLTWRNVTFPEDGSYKVKMQGDNIASFTINGVDIRTTTDFVGDPIEDIANITKGTYDLVITLTNTKVASDIFAVNPSGVALEITKQTSVIEADAFSWQQNPVAISAVLISPPCPKKISGKGVVSKVIPAAQGNTPSIKNCKDPNATYNLVTQKCECNPGYTLNSTTGKCEQTTPIPPPPGPNPICSTSTKGYTGPGIYLDLTKKTGKQSIDIKISSPADSFEVKDGNNNITINASKVYDLDGGRIYGPISSKSGTVYVGSELIPPLTKLSDNDLVILDTDGNIIMTLNASAPIGSFVRCGSLTPFPTPTPTPTPPPPTPTPPPPTPTPPPPTPGPQVSGYPVCLILESVIIDDPGINYECGVDKLSIVPDNGVVLDYICDPFGKIKEVKIVSEGTCFSVYPRITLPSKTGINASFTPVFKVIRDPLDPALTGERQKLLQVTDLVGLKQTGYVDGRAYYGSVFYDQGAKYAGYYKTIGEPIRVYDTLQESITAQVTTPPSAIQRVGTDVTANDPKLNIPGTLQ